MGWGYSVLGNTQTLFPANSLSTLADSMQVHSISNLWCPLDDLSLFHVTRQLGSRVIRWFNPLLTFTRPLIDKAWLCNRFSYRLDSKSITMGLERHYVICKHCRTVLPSVTDLSYVSLTGSKCTARWNKLDKCIGAASHCQKQRNPVRTKHPTRLPWLVV